MIIIGYQGIGKSSLAGDGRMIDLESGNFWVDGNRDEKWYMPYCNIALSLHRQGYIVFTSSHKVVRDYLKEIASPKDWDSIFVCYPDKELKEAWIHKLELRYQDTKLDKDYKAWKDAECRFEEAVRELDLCGFKKIHIDMMDYELVDLIQHRVRESFCNMFKTAQCEERCKKKLNQIPCDRVICAADDCLQENLFNPWRVTNE